MSRWLRLRVDVPVECTRSRLYDNPSLHAGKGHRPVPKGWLASAKLRSLVEVILARPIRGQDFKFSCNVIFLSTTDVIYVGDEVDPRPVLQEVDQHV